MKNTSISIAIFGNINNYPFLLAQGLRSLGHNVRLILNRKEILHRPEALYPSWVDNYPEWVFDCSNVTEEDLIYKNSAIDAVINYLTDNVDLVILNDTGPTLVGWLSAPHVVLLTGSDLAYFASFDSLRMRASAWSPEFKRSLQGQQYLSHFSDFVTRQRDGIKSAETVCYGQRGLIPSGDMLLDEMGVQDHRRLMLYLSNTVNLQSKPAPQNQLLTILSGSRIVYRPECNRALSAIDFKGTDVLIKGFAKFLRGGGQGELRLPRKGQDLEAAVALIANLGIGNNIRWLNEAPLAQFYEEMAAADLICDQFGTSFPGMVTTDAYALGRPVMANLRNEIFGQRFSEILPGFDAKTPEQVAEYLISVERNRGLLVDMGHKSRAFAERYLSPQSMAQQLLRTVGGL